MSARPSKAQRYALERARRNADETAQAWTPYSTYGVTRQNTVECLERRGLVELRIETRDGGVYRITDAGRAVLSAEDERAELAVRHAEARS